MTDTQQYAAYARAEQVNQIDAELAALRARLDSYDQSLLAPQPGFEYGSDAPWKKAGIVTGAELTYLEPLTRAGSNADAAKFDLRPGWRVWLGYERSDGWGARLRYWQWNHNAGAIVNSMGDTLDSQIFAQTAEMDVTHEFPFRRWSVNLGAGIRFSSLDTSMFNSGQAAQPVNDSRFHGTGATLILSGRKPLKFGLTAVGSVRYSYLFGGIEDNLDFGGAGGGFYDNAFMDVMDMQLGGEWHHDMGCGVRAFTRLVFDVQAWHSADLDTLNSDLVFMGPSFSIGIDR